MNIILAPYVHLETN